FIIQLIAIEDLMYPVGGDVEHTLRDAFLFWIPKDFRIGAVSRQESDCSQHYRLSGAGLPGNDVKAGSRLHFQGAYQCVVLYGKALEHQGSTSMYASTMLSRSIFIFFFLMFQSIA